MPPEPYTDELLSAYLDGELTQEERMVVEQRLAEDAATRQTLEELRAVSETLRGLPVGTPDEGFTSEVMHRVAEAAPAPSVSGDAPNAEEATGGPVGFRVPFARSPRGWLWAGMAVAAALVLMVAAPQTLQQKRDVAAIKKPAAEAHDAPTALSAPAEGSDNLEMSARDEGAGGLARAESAESHLADEAGPPAERAEESLAVASVASADAPNSGSGQSRRLATPSPPLPTVADASGVSSAYPPPAHLRPASPLSATPSPSRPARFALEPAQPLGSTSPQLVVLVKLRPEAYRNNFVDKLLTTQGIAVEPAAEFSSTSASDARPTTSADSSPVQTRALPRQSAQAGRVRSSSVDAETQKALPAVTDNADLLVVDAPASQLAACLNELKNDPANCLSVFVCPTDQSESKEANASDTVAEGSTEGSRVGGGFGGGAKAPRGDLAKNQAWQFYNRAAPTVKEKASLQNLQIQNAQQATPLPRAYRLSAPQLSQQALAADSLDLGALRQQASKGPLAGKSEGLPAPTDEVSQIQALLICEPHQASESSPATATPAAPPPSEN